VYFSYYTTENKEFPPVWEIFFRPGNKECSRSIYWFQNGAIIARREVYFVQDQENAMVKAMKLANSDAGKELLKILQQSQPDALQSAMNQAASGNYEAIQKTMSAALSSPEVQRILRQMRG
jgi:hypothetical protein